MTEAAIWNTFGMLRLTPWILDQFIYFLDPWLFVILWKNGWTDVHDFYKKRHVRHKKQLARLFHIWLDCFTVSHLGIPGVFVRNTTVKSISEFSWHFDDMLAMTQTQGTTWNILGMIGSTPCTWFLFLFSGSVFVGNITEYRMDGYSWNFQDMDSGSNRLHCFTLE